ncbi:hypothetical protein PtA15_17A235 [Puccinia triticina]|uniref:Uncharacterized protein n=1 Tax=Puccinia triticina TaxID=208348 RepID=A0ABY7D553_9BASI|nr:uncharacterized protein PtA15_17A235 [Puccinia triticina]WAQ92753.1 hypothetical protein PtA15_17A235 [Puccinia triticina]
MINSHANNPIPCKFLHHLQLLCGPASFFGNLRWLLRSGLQLPPHILTSPTHQDAYNVVRDLGRVLRAVKEGKIACSSGPGLPKIARPAAGAADQISSQEGPAAWFKPAQALHPLPFVAHLPLRSDLRAVLWCWMAARLRSDSRLQPLLKQEQPSHNLGARFKGIGLLWRGIVPTPTVTILDRDHVVYILGYNMLRSASSNHHLTPLTVSRLPGGYSAEESALESVPLLSLTSRPPGMPRP